ncbi:MAG: hypothetical protein ACRDZO_17240 [Egibacteraceae bacterium]
MLTAVPLVLPDQPLTIPWQSTVIDVEPGSRYGYANDAASINTTLAIVNNTGAVLEFPLLLATTDPEDVDPSQLSVRVASETKELEEAELDTEWEAFAQAILAQGQAQGHAPERINWYLHKLRSELRQLKKSNPVVLEPGEEKFIRSYQRKRVKGRDNVYEFRGIFPLPQFALTVGGTISVAVALPRSTQRFAVDLVDWTRNYGPQAFGRDPGLPQVAGRHVVSWFWGNDPELYVSYRYSN